MEKITSVIRFKNWFLILLIYIIADIILQFTRVPLGTFDIIIYSINLILTFSQFYLIETIRKKVNRYIGAIIVFIFCFWIALIFVSSIFIFNEFGDYITASKFQFNKSNIYYFYFYVKTYLINWSGLGLILLALILLFIWIPLKNYESNETKISKSTIRIFLLIIIIAVSLTILVFTAERKKLTPEASFYVAVINGEKYQSELLRNTERIKVQSFCPKDSLNILLIVHESFGKKALTSENNKYAMPFLRHFFIEDTNQVFNFLYAFSQSGSTEISMPSLFSGVGPWESKYKLHSLPLIWDWARAGGLKTLFLSAQAYYWGNLDKFLLSPGPDDFLPVNILGVPLLHDGADEIEVSNIFCDSLKSYALSGHNFLAIYNSNACHKPHQQSTKFLNENEQMLFKSDYRNSALLLDYSLKDFIDVLKETNTLEKTIIIITGDHGETDSLYHPPLYRLYNYYDETINIPFFIRFPKDYIEKYPSLIQNLKLNQKRIIANMDVVPTIIQILNADNQEYNKIILKNLLGYSLLQLIPNERFTISMTTNDIRRWEYEGFGIAYKNWRYVFSNIEKEGIYDISNDINQKNNIYNSAPKEIQLFFQNLINSIHNLRYIYHKWK